MFLSLLLILLAFLAPATAHSAGNGVQVASVSVSGNFSVPAQDIGDFTALRPGSSWNPEERALTPQIISSLYRSRGFMEASASVSELLRGNSVYLSIEVREGPRYAFGETTFTGLAKVRRKTAQKEIAYSRGEPYSHKKLLASQGQLYATNWFEKLRTRVSSGSAAGVVDVEVVVEEKPLKWIKGGVGYGSEEKERFSLGFTHNNFVDRGYKLDLGWMVSRISLEYRADFTNRHFLDSRTELRGSSGWRREQRSGYELETIRNTVSLGRRLLAGIYGSVQYRMQRSLIYDVNPSISAETPSLSRIRSAAVSLNRDTSDDFFYPSRGLRSELTLERSGGIWGGDINFYRASLRNTAYRRLFDGVTGLVSARWAFVHETGSTPDVPIYERLFYGGANSVRGYAERGVGPADSDGNPLGGKVLLGASMEVRFPLYKKLRGALFTDGGQVADSLPGAAPRRWRYGAGAGLRYRTPVGPIRADFGYKLNPDKPVSPELWRLHLSIGEAF